MCNCIITNFYNHECPCSFDRTVSEILDYNFGNIYQENTAKISHSTDFNSLPFTNRTSTFPQSINQESHWDVNSTAGTDVRYVSSNKVHENFNYFNSSTRSNALMRDKFNNESLNIQNSAYRNFENRDSCSSPEFCQATLDGQLSVNHLPQYSNSHLYCNDKIKAQNCFQCQFCGKVSTYQKHQSVQKLPVNESSKKLDYSLSFLNANGFPEKLLDTSGDFCQAHYGNRLYVSLDELFIRRRNAFLPQDTLTIQCHVKRINSAVPAFIRSTARTRISVERNLFTWNLGDFSSLRKGDTREIAVESSAGKFSPLTLKLSIVGEPISEERIQIKVHRGASSAVSFSKLKISPPNNEKKSVDTIEDEFLFQSIKRPISYATHLMKKTHLFAAKDQLLRNDVLSLKCESSNSFGVVSNLIEVIERGSDFLQDFGICNGTQDSSESLKDAMEQLLSEKILCGVTLQVGSAEFPAHKALLATRSPVFKAMFTRDMQETARDTVDISDLDADTVKSMLLYVYTDTLDHPEGDSVEKLYFAADKYEILCLKKKCALLLKSDLRESNACHILLLADRHRDEYLKEAVCSFISKYCLSLLQSEEWKSFKERHSQLTIQVLEYICLKKMHKTLDA
ncbi:TD and POZ domain-containing protein 1 [Caerostris darwini]|uniref:TD and POZ domain-containing protein 1 n=1 Tax=Caerostris darwini TaxID=1538125 RepID=A0AAV4T0Z4_9ARAC|nr:TD and POZ domain-containing protein 1 [Caerostris darwini]